MVPYSAGASSRVPGGELIDWSFFLLGMAGDGRDGWWVVVVWVKMGVCILCCGVWEPEMCVCGQEGERRNGKTWRQEEGEVGTCGRTDTVLYAAQTHCKYLHRFDTPTPIWNPLATQNVD